MRNGWALVVGLGITVAVACTPGPSDDECTSTGGECIGNNLICNGSLPYQCSQGGTCCLPGQSTAAGASTSSPDAAPPADASTTTLDSATSSMDASSAADTATTTPDTGAAPDSAATGDDGGDDSGD